MFAYVCKTLLLQLQRLQPKLLKLKSVENIYVLMEMFEVGTNSGFTVHYLTSPPIIDCHYNIYNNLDFEIKNDLSFIFPNTADKTGFVSDEG